MQQVWLLLVSLALVASLPVELISSQVFNVWSYEDYLKQLAAHQDETANDIEADDISQPWDHPVLPEDRYEVIIDETITEHDEPSPVLIPATAREEAERASVDAVIAQDNYKPVTQEPVIATAADTEGRTINIVTQEFDNEGGSGFEQDHFQGSGSSLPDSIPVDTPINTGSTPDLLQSNDSIDSCKPDGSSLKDEGTGIEATTDTQLKESALTTLMEDAMVSTTFQPTTDADYFLPSTTQNPTTADDDVTNLTTIALEGDSQARQANSLDETTILPETTVVIDTTTNNEPQDFVTVEDFLLTTWTPEETTSTF